MQDLLNEQGNFCNFLDFKTKFNLGVPFTKFYGLINAIPRAWKNALKPHGQNNLNDTSTTPLITP